MDRNKNVETKNSQLDTFQSMLDAAGFVPGYGEPADLLNALISLGRGNKKEAAISTLSALPLLGAFGGLKLFKDVKFKKTGPNEPDEIIENIKDYDDALRDNFEEMGDILAKQAERAKSRLMIEEYVDITDPRNLKRPIGELNEQFKAKAGPIMERLTGGYDDLTEILLKLRQATNKKELLDVFRRAGKN